MELEGDNSFVVPQEGGSKEFRIKARHKPERWRLTDNNVTVCDWASFEAEYDEASETYTVKVIAQPNTTAAERKGDLFLSSPGSRVVFAVDQKSAVEGISADSSSSVKFNGNEIIVAGGKESLELFDISGRLIATAALDGTVSAIDARSLPKGIYIVKVDGKASAKIIKWHVYQKDIMRISPVAAGHSAGG